MLCYAFHHSKAYVIFFIYLVLNPTMLQKKSEYKLQYSKLNNDLRRKIWQDNIAARKSRLSTNQATHYWEYQLRDENFDHDDGTSEEDNRGPLPPHVKKHKELREQYKQKGENENLVRHLESFHNAREIAVQTPEWSGDEQDGTEEELLKNISVLTLPEAGQSQSRPSSPVPPKSLAPPSARPRTAVSLPRPTRTSRRLCAEPKRTHFVPFGWNETKTDVGHKLTYNTTAPKNQVHESAVHAAQRRKAEIEQFLAQEKLSRQTHQTRSRERTVSGSSSQWMSEYQEQFSAKSSCRGPRPLSAPPAPRPVSWRRS